MADDSGDAPEDGREERDEVRDAAHAAPRSGFRSAADGGLLGGAPVRPLVVDRLDNGLRVVVERDERLPIVAVNLWYLVGSRDEEPGRTGFAHLFEHVMFEGSAHVAPGEHFAALQSAGASLNASTGFDRTNYFETIPSSHLELALWLEADRMGALDVTEETFRNQRDVVKNEKRQRYDNQPYGDLIEVLHRLAYPDGHPYQHLPIGAMADLDAAGLDDAAAFHRTWYVPDNCVLSIVGDVDPVDAVATAARYFGGIPASGDLPSHPAPTLPYVLDAPAREVVRADVPVPQVTIAFRASPCLPTADHDAVSVLAGVLGWGRGSRLHRTLVVERELVEPDPWLVSCWGLTGDANLFVSRLRARAGVDPAAVEAAFEEVAAEVTAGLDEHELDRVRAIALRRHQLALSSVTSRADRYSRYTTLLGDPALAFAEPERLAAVTAEDVAGAATRYLDPSNRVVVVHVPRVGGGG